MTPGLVLSGLTKRFGSTLALSDVSLHLAPGEVHAVMGENGAGKSTLMKLACGVHRADAGTIALDGRPLSVASPADAAAAGIHVVFQELTVLPNLTVAQNLLIGREPARAGGLWLDHKAAVARAGRILASLGIALDPAAPAATLSAGARQLVEIARAASRRPRVLILDEPTSSLGRAEEEVLFALVRRLRAEGVALAYVTHRMAEVFALSDRVSVLRDGRHVLTAPMAGLTRPALIRAMVGRTVDEARAGAEVAGAPVLTLRGLVAPPLVAGVDLDLRRGEVLGLAGLMGAGRTETARVIAGIDPAAGGSMTLDGKPFAPASPAAAMAAGIAYLSEDRKRLGLHLDLSVADNIALPSLPALARRGWVSPGRVTALARDWMARLAVRAAGPGIPVGTLSGGNQQKVAIARWLARGPRVILLDEPTRGVDVGAKAEIYALIRRLAAEGAAVLVISSELPELLQLSDRIAVMAQGRVAGIVPAAGATEESLLTLAFADTVAGAA
jgi:ABC-type sugar transport system ATPase subunit